MKNTIRRSSSFFAVTALALFASACSGPAQEDSAGAFHPGEQLTSFSEQITSPVHDFQVKAGGEYTLNVNVKNTGSQPWFRDAPTAPVRLSYRWFGTDGKMLPIEGQRALLSTPVLKPGDSDAMKLKVTAPPSPGSYILRVSMVQEGVNWFYDRGAKPLDLQATVS